MYISPIGFATEYTDKMSYLSRSDRTAKYNQLMRIEEELRRTARYGV